LGEGSVRVTARPPVGGRRGRDPGRGRGSRPVSRAARCLCNDVYPKGALQRRVPKRGFTNIFKKKFALVNLRDLNRFEANSIVDVETLRKAGLVKKVHDGVKILGRGRITVPLTLRVHRVTKGAAEKILAVEGRIEGI